MKKFSATILTSIVISSSVMMMSQSAVADVKVNYSGDETAKPICVSIVHDRLNSLKRALKNSKTHPLDQPHTFFKCNDMPLDEFAVIMDSDKTGDYLQRKFNRKEIVTTEEIALK